MTRNRRTAAPRGGFTLVEILVVIAIIALLIGLLLPVLGRVRISARETDNAQHMQQIATSINNYNSKMNVDFIPAHGGGTGGAFRLCTCYARDAAGNPLVDGSGQVWPEIIYLKQVFPQMNLMDNGLRLKNAAGVERFVVNPVFTPTPAPNPTTTMQNLDANQTLTFFLTGSTFTQATGFSNNKQQPFKAPTSNTEVRVGPFLEAKANADFDDDLSKAPPNAVDRPLRLVDKFGTPYAYFSAHSWTNSAFRTDYASGTYTQTYNDIKLQPAGSVSPLHSGGTPVKYQNPKSFQIVSAGANRRFGRGGAYVAGQNDYAPNGIGYDDFSTFQVQRLGESP